MAFTFKHFKAILEDWLTYVVGNSEISDINPGSVVRTIGEATSLEMAQAYVQMQKLLDVFSIDRASGEDLDERAVDFGLERSQPEKSSGNVTIGDSSLTVGDTATSTLAATLTAGVSTFATIQAADYAAFPASGTMILDRGNGLRESIAWTSKTGPDKLNFPGATFPVSNHSIGATVHRSTVGTDRTVPSGTVVSTPDPDAIEFETQATVTLYDGDYQITNVQVQSIETGEATNVAAGSVSQFASPPFATATVTNPSSMTGGVDYEEDAEFRARIKETQQALSSSTAVRIQKAALEVVLVSTGQRVITARVIEPVTIGVVDLYINDGTTNYTPTTVSQNQTDVMISVAEAGQRRAAIKNWPIQSGTEQIFVSKDRGTASAVGVNSLTDATKAWSVNQWAGFKVKDENNTFFTIVSNTATVLTLSGGGTPQLGAYAIINPAVTAFPTGSKLTTVTDYVFNPTNGQLELTLTSFPSGLTAKDCLVAYYDGVTAAYVYYDGLLREVQKVINGDPTDLDAYPGVKAAGTRVNVLAPSIVTITVDMTISASAGVDESTIRDSVKVAILNYINALTIGEDVLVSRIVEAALSVSGVYDATIITPASNTVITDSQLAKTLLANITVS